MIEIRSGLCKLEFTPEAGGSDHQRASVEFVRETPLATGEIVRIPLGRRDGCLRELSGLPRLMETKRLTLGRQYLYRLSGAVATSSAS